MGITLGNVSDLTTCSPPLRPRKMKAPALHFSFTAARVAGKSPKGLKAANNINKLLATGIFESRKWIP
jgi:hypothetical protein